MKTNACNQHIGSVSNAVIGAATAFINNPLAKSELKARHFASARIKLPQIAITFTYYKISVCKLPGVTRALKSDSVNTNADLKSIGGKKVVVATSNDRSKARTSKTHLSAIAIYKARR
ncbi:hypothetical protein HC024_15510 [Methylococcaceae bacterium WWC4]|nr:hypothetical protein [Methylococcaceae bacterium WWC4]